MDAWREHIEDLRVGATTRLFNEDGSTEDDASRVYRYVCHGRLMLIENVDDGFTVLPETGTMLAKHRSRCATIWNDKTPMPGSAVSGSGVDKSTAKSLTDLRNKAELARNGKTPAKRAQDAYKAELWQTDLIAHTPSLRLSAFKPPPGHKQLLRTHWSVASTRSTRTLSPSTNDLRKLSGALVADLPERVLPTAGVSANGDGCIDVEEDPDLASVTEEAYEAMAAEWLSVALSAYH